MWFDGLILAVLLACMVVGAWRGALETGFRLFALFAAYALALLAAGTIGGPAAEATGLPRWLGTAAVGAAGFLLAHLLLGACAVSLRSWEQERAGERGLGPGSRLAGAGFGALRALLLWLPLLWLGQLLQGVGTTGAAPQLPDLAGARLPELGGRLAAAGAASVIDAGDTEARLKARLLTRPGVAARGLHELLEHPRLRALQRDAEFWRLVETRQSERALRRPSFVKATFDTEFRASLHELALIDADSAADPRLFREEMATLLDELGPRLERVRNDPALHALLEDPAFVANVESGDLVAVLAHPGFQELVSRVSQDPG